MRAPKGMSRQEINVFINGKRSWIEKHLAEIQERKSTIEQLAPFTIGEIRELADKTLIVILEKAKRMLRSFALYTEKLLSEISVRGEEVVLVK